MQSHVYFTISIINKHVYHFFNACCIIRSLVNKPFIYHTSNIFSKICFLCYVQVTYIFITSVVVKKQHTTLLLLNCCCLLFSSCSAVFTTTLLTAWKNNNWNFWSYKPHENQHLKAVYSIDVDYYELISTVCAAEKGRLTPTPIHLLAWVLTSDHLLTFDFLQYSIIILLVLKLINCPSWVWG